MQAIQDPNMKVGETAFLSALDVMKINKLYDCPQAKTLGTSFFCATLIFVTESLILGLMLDVLKYFDDFNLRCF